MPTIKELVDAHSKVPGDIRVTTKSMCGWFQPFFETPTDKWIGPCAANNEYLVVGKAANDDWHLYTEQKPKVKRAQYLVITSDDGVPIR